jgi:hypothetical protein
MALGQFTMDPPNPSEEPNLNTGTPWRPSEDRDIRWGLDDNKPIEEIADFLCRTPSEIRQRIEKIAEADAIADPSLLYDRFTHRDRVSLETYRDARTALALIREAVEDCAPPGSGETRRLFATRFYNPGQALVRGIYAVAGRYLRASSGV